MLDWLIHLDKRSKTSRAVIIWLVLTERFWLVRSVKRLSASRLRKPWMLLRTTSKPSRTTVPSSVILTAWREWLLIYRMNWSSTTQTILAHLSVSLPILTTFRSIVRWKTVTYRAHLPLLAWLTNSSPESLRAARERMAIWWKTPCATGVISCLLPWRIKRLIPFLTMLQKWALPHPIWKYSTHSMMTVK